MIKTVTLAFFAGAVILHHLPALPPAIPVYAAVIIVLLTAIRLPVFKSNRGRFAVFLLIGFAWAHFQASNLLAQRLDEELIGKDIQIEGYIADLPNQSGRKVRFEFDVVRVTHPLHRQVPTKLMLSVYNATALDFVPGQHWRFTVRLKPAHDFANPGSFSYSKWLFQQGILATGYVRNLAGAQQLTSGWRDYPLQRIRHRIQQRLQLLDTDGRYLPFVTALLIGERQGLQTQDWKTLQATGTSHLMAISGLHVGLISMLAFFLGRLMLSFIPGLSTRVALPRLAAVMAWFAALGYASLAGFALPTQRALVMLSVILLAIVIQKRTAALNVLCLSLLLVLLFDSLAVFSVSFWLSFAAVAIIYYFMQVTSGMQATKPMQRIRAMLTFQAAISVAMLPLTVQFFQQAPLASPLANIIAVPVVGLLVVPLAFATAVCLYVHEATALVLYKLTVTIFAAVWKYLTWLGDGTFSQYVFATPSTLVLLLSLIGITLLFLPGALTLRVCGIMCCVPLFFPAPPPIQQGEFHVTVLDVGQGLSVVVRTHAHSLVYDTGPRFSSDFDTGRAVVVPYLHEQGIRRLHRVLVSHADNDHIGGAASILAAIPAEKVSSSVPAKLAEVSPVPVERCERGQSWQWDGVRFTVIHPTADDYAQGLSENDLSCVLAITTARRQVILSGDIEHQAEALILQRDPQIKAIDLLVVPHHGSRTSSTPAFVQQLQPAIAVFPVGWRNRFGLPRADVVERYRTIRAELYFTSDSGAVSWNSHSGEVGRHRLQNRSYWD